MGTLLELLLTAVIFINIHISHMSCSSFVAAADVQYPYPFMTGDAEKASGRAYDYIIVGGGTAGCPLAATLSLNYSVLVVERGDSPYGDPDIENEAAFLRPLMESDEYYSVAQTFKTEDGVDVARGRVLGGSSALNAGFYSRASVEYIVERMGWNEALVNESYNWVEREVAFAPERLGPWQSAFRDALVEKGVLPYNGYTLDHVAGTKISASIFDGKGKRHSAADLLKHANPLNIVVLLNATAKRILFHPSESRCDLTHKPRAVGVEFVNRENTVSRRVLAKENGEVILCAGAMGSPQLLLLSGIGPSDHLKDFGIPLIVESQGVGDGVADGPRSNVNVLSRLPVEISRSRLVGVLNNSEIYIESGSTFRKVRTISASQVEEDDTEYAFCANIFAKVAEPLSSGELRLRTLDPRDNPSVRYNYYSHPLDVSRCIQGVNMVGSLLQSSSLQRFAYDNATAIPDYLLPESAKLGPSLPENRSDDAAMERFCWDTLATVWHYHGGCSIGSVIDEKYNVIGVEGLRVVDSSTFGSSPGTNPQATTMMLGRYDLSYILMFLIPLLASKG